MPFATLDNVRVYYEEQGEGSAILFLHNHFGTLDVWSAQREVLGHYHRVIVADTRGHGRTLHPGGRLRLIDLVGDTAQLIRYLGIVPVHLVGSSLGALVALYLARDQPGLVRTLTAVGPPHLNESTTQAYMNRVIRETFPANEERMDLKHQDQGPGHARPVLLHNFALDREEKPRGLAEALELAGEIAPLTLIVGGDNDPVFPARRALELRERIPGSELFLLPHGGHFPHRTMAYAFNEVLLDFLRRRA